MAFAYNAMTVRMSKPPYKLQLTKGFFVDFAQISRMVMYAVAYNDKGRISSEQYRLGIGLSSSRVENLASLAAALGLLRPSVLTCTELGRLICGSDPYFDDIGTLWLLHYVVSSDERYVVWNRLVNQVIPPNPRLSAPS